jgi:hypothetical protein
MFLMVLTIPIAHLPRARLSLENRKQGIYTVSDDWRGAAKGPFTVLRAKDRATLICLSTRFCFVASGKAVLKTQRGTHSTSIDKGCQRFARDSDPTLTPTCVKWRHASL